MVTEVVLTHTEFTIVFVIVKSKEKFLILYFKRCLLSMVYEFQAYIKDAEISTLVFSPTPTSLLSFIIQVVS